MVNPKIAMLIGIFAIIMIAGGETDFEKAMKEQKAKYGDVNDPLIRAIAKYHDENSLYEGGESLGNGLDETGRKADPMPDYMYHNRRSTNPTSRDRQRDTNNYDQTDTRQKNKSYYPPPPMPRSTSDRLKRDRRSNNYDDYYNRESQPRSDLLNSLDNGQRLAYEGSKIFFVDQNGVKRRPPNGTYRTGDGRTIEVYDGKRVIASN